MNLLLKRYLIPFLAAGVLFSACSLQESPITGNKRAYGYSWEQELKIGGEADQQIQTEYGVYDNEEIAEYIDNIGQEMLEVSHMRRDDTPEKYRNTEFTFRVLDSPVVNAFALPGGYVYVTRGLLAHLDNEAQLAVVIGHEIGHVAARHSSQRALQQQIGQIALIGGAVAGEQFLGLPGGDILNLGSQAAQFIFMSYGREDERESDALGVEYSAMEEYVAAEGAAFFVSLERKSEQAGQSIPEWQSTHPDPSQRADRIPELAKEWEEKGYPQTILDRDEFMQIIDGVIYGNNPREGFTRDGYFYHPDMEFQFPYPESWQVINQRMQVVITNDNQDAIAIMRLDQESDTPRQSVEDFLDQDGINRVSSSSVENNNLQAHEGIATAQTEDGESLKLYLYSVEHDDTIYRFITYTLESQFDEYEDRFKEITGGFAALNDQELLDIQPVRLEVKRAERTDTFESFLPDLEAFSISVSAEDLAIVNQVELDEEIEEGEWIKIPVQ